MGAERFGTGMSDRLIEVLVDCPGVQGLYTYRIPEALTLAPGDILSVPFGGRTVGAIALRLGTTLPQDLDPSQIQPVSEVVAQGFFRPSYWQLLEQVASYYCTPLIQVIRVALPPGLLSRSQSRIRLRPLLAQGDKSLSPAAQRLLELLLNAPDQDYSWRFLQQKLPRAAQALRELQRLGWVERYLSVPKPTAAKLQQAVSLIQGQREGLTAKQDCVVQLLQAQGGDQWLSELLRQAEVSASVVQSLERKGIVAIAPRERLRQHQEPEVSADQPQHLTAAQQQALQMIQEAQGGTQLLLHGVTGSGKTEVYLQAIAPLLAAGQSALVLVPEIGLTPQLTDRFRRRFGEQIRVYHSGLSDGERYDAWREMLTGEALVVIGTRSAILTPLANLGLIILDEEHDNSFKQEQPMPCYHARSVAQWRARLEHCPLLLGSATPAIETWAQAQELVASSLKRQRYLSLPERIQAQPLPPVSIVDMRQELAAGNRSIFSRSLQEALQTLKQTGQQGILFVPRRGHSTFVSCRSCGMVLECPHCDVSLTYHLMEPNTQPLLRCHYCNYAQAQPQRCPACGSPYLKHFGSGSQRVALELKHQCPEITGMRFDSDTTRHKGGHRQLLEQFSRGEADVLVGTQMITKGLDLPQVTLVGVVAADGLLHLPDFRAGERALQTLVQVAGRAGRGPEGGQVIVQTYSPDDPVVSCLKQHAYTPFLNQELKHRQENHYPPFMQLVLLRLSGIEEASVAQTAETFSKILRQQTPGITILGPAPAPVYRVARRYRWHLLIKLTADQSPMSLNLADLQQQVPKGISLIVDIDPQSS
jgi:primosomal protein N' (replication factor Y) (superfamily II helicase)